MHCNASVHRNFTLKKNGTIRLLNCKNPTLRSEVDDKTYALYFFRRNKFTQACFES